MKQAEEKLPSWPTSLRVINQQLWYCCGGDGGIVVFDSELQQQRTIWDDHMSTVFDVAQMSNGDVVIAASDNRLYHRHNGECSGTK